MSTTREQVTSIPAVEPVASPQSLEKPPRILRRMLALEDFEKAAPRYIPRPICGYVLGGSETNASLRGNRAVWDEIAFVPKALVDVSKRMQRTTLFGRTYDMPFGLAPMGGTAMAAYQGDIVLARAAAEANIPMVLSGAAVTPLEAVRKAGPTAWFQAYLPGDNATITQLVERVERAGYDTLVLTVDVPVMSNRENNVRSGFHTPLRPTPRLAWDCAMRPHWLFGMFLRTLLVHGMPYFENMGPRVPLLSRTGERDRGPRDQLAWTHLELMRRLWKGRLVVKGILDKADARIARESGADGIIVSNHGGRQLDGVSSTARALPHVADVIEGQIPLLADGGIRSGLDVVRMLALGANFALLGRAWAYALAASGQAGVAHVLKLIEAEMRVAMALTGCTAIGQVNEELLDRSI